MAKISGFATALSLSAILAGFGGGYAIASLSDAYRPETGSTGALAPSHTPEEPLGAVDHGEDAPKDNVDEPLWMNERLVFLGRITVPVERPGGTSYVVTDLAVAMATEEEALGLKSPDKALRMRDTVLGELRGAAAGRLLREKPMDTERLSLRLKKALEAQVGYIEEMLLLSFFVADVPRT